MLDLGSHRWTELRSHFTGEAAVPELIAAWKHAIGTPSEDEAYDVLFEHYLHQLTILSCAYAVVPHVVSVLPLVGAARRLEYLTHVSHVEMSRLSREEVEAAVDEVRRSEEVPDSMREHFVEITRDRHPDLPADLSQDYLRALEEAKSQAVALLREPWTSYEFSRLLGALTGLFARRESDLARALLNPEGLAIECEYDGKASVSALLRDYARE